VETVHAAFFFPSFLQVPGYCGFYLLRVALKRFLEMMMMIIIIIIIIIITIIIITCLHGSAGCSRS
jgi:hypothetical protein